VAGPLAEAECLSIWWAKQINFIFFFPTARQEKGLDEDLTKVACFHPKDFGFFYFCAIADMHRISIHLV
jgi:hypothetical protein